MRGRLLFGFVLIFSLFLVNLAVHQWSRRNRDESFEALRDAMARQTLTARLRQRTADLQKEMALLSEVYSSPSPLGAPPEELEGFRTEVVRLDRDLQELESLAVGEASARVRRFAAACRDLAWSWERAFESFGVDPARSITELSLRADPLGARVLRELLPEIEQDEARRVIVAREGYYRAVRFADGVTAGMLVLSLPLGLFVAISLSRYLVSVQRGLEERVEARTRELQASVARLRESEDRYALAARGANDGLWDWDIRGEVVYYSPRWCSMLGLPDEETNASPELWLDRVHPEERVQMRSAIDDHLAGRSLHLEREHRILVAGGGYRWFVARGLAVRNPAGEATRMAGSLTDVTSRKVAESRLLHDAFHDGLTGLPNRALFLDRLGVARARAQAGAARRHQAPFAVLFLDLDRFKVVNDGLGHATGDALLVEVARRLKECVRPGDTVARLGGDEFTVLLEDVADAEASGVVAERIQRAVEQPLSLGGAEVFTTVSAGIAFGDPSYGTSEDILRDADTALYRAKAQGKGQWVLFDSSMRTRAAELLELENGLRRAVERQELRLVYQPILALGSGATVGFEALLRWDHPKRGLLSALDFIDLAEDTGLIVSIGHWVVGEACRALCSWPSAGPEGREITVSVNVSARQFAHPGLVADVRDALQESGLAPSRLCLEITETAIVAHAHAARDTLASLRALGVRLHMDDFGTGYSSMSYLRDFAIDVLKIDRSFASRLGNAGENAQITRTIVELGHGLGLEVIAEGIETAAQAEILRAFGCEYGQGYFFSTPLLPEAVVLHLSGTPSTADPSRPPLTS